MKVVNMRSVSNLKCQCGQIMLIIPNDRLKCTNDECDYHGRYYKFPKNIYIELEEVK
jgi:hypothetical protein